MIELICEICGNTFSRNIGEYNRSVKKGRKSYCSRKCTGKVVGKNLAGHRSDYNISQHSGNRNDEFTPFRLLFRTAKRRAEERDREFSITLKDLEEVWENQNGKCPYTGWDLDYVPWRKTERNPKQCSLDRIDCEKGYTKDNIQFICMIANFAKNNFTDSQVLEFCQAVVENKKAQD